MSDTLKDIICPACGEVMVKIKTTKGINVDICTKGCGGIWFDNRETDVFKDENISIDEINKILADKEFRKVDENKIRLCPVCNKKMVQHKPSPNCEIMIDDCYNCGGKFLDYKELDKIRETEDSAEKAQEQLIAALYRKNGYVPYRGEKTAIKSFLGELYSNFCR